MAENLELVVWRGRQEGNQDRRVDTNDSNQPQIPYLSPASSLENWNGTMVEE